MLVKIDDVIRQVRLEAEQNPDFNYRESYGPVCEYVDECGDGKCIIGKALVSLGVDVSVFRLGACSDTGNMNSVPIWNLWSRFIEDEGFNSTTFRDRVRWLTYVQNEQDTGSTWQESIENADTDDC